MDTLSKILTIMKHKNISNSAIAEHLGISVSQISNWKSGNNTSYLKYISQISEFLEVSADYLLGTEQKEKSMSEKDKLIEKITVILKNADIDTLNAFLKLAENMKK